MAEQKQGKWSFSFTTDSGVGKIEVDSENLWAFGKKIERKMVSAISDVEKAALGKVKVEFEYYDLMGNKNTLEFLMNENEFRALKKTLGE